MQHERNAAKKSILNKFKEWNYKGAITGTAGTVFLLYFIVSPDNMVFLTPIIISTGGAFASHLFNQQKSKQEKFDTQFHKNLATLADREREIVFTDPETNSQTLGKNAVNAYYTNIEQILLHLDMMLHPKIDNRLPVCQPFPFFTYGINTVKAIELKPTIQLWIKTCLSIINDIHNYTQNQDLLEDYLKTLFNQCNDEEKIILILLSHQEKNEYKEGRFQLIEATCQKYGEISMTAFQSRQSQLIRLTEEHEICIGITTQYLLRDTIKPRNLLDEKLLAFFQDFLKHPTLFYENIQTMADKYRTPPTHPKTPTPNT